MDLFDSMREQNRTHARPLAARMRPRSLPSRSARRASSRRPSELRSSARARSIVESSIRRASTVTNKADADLKPVPSLPILALVPREVFGLRPIVWAGIVVAAVVLIALARGFL